MKLSVFLDHCRKDEFVCLVIVIGSLNCCSSVCSFYAFSGCKSVVCKLYTIPTVVTVHCIVTSGNCSDLTYTDLLHLSFQSFYKFFSRCRRCVTSVEKTVYINFLNAFSLSHLK